jgi:insertion element IS1 protein InsB
MNCGHLVDHKGNKQWVWLAMDADTREIIGCHIGDRSRASALALWQSLPPVYRQCAQVYTDYWDAYETVIPSQRHCAVGKESGLTSYIERLNNTLRQRVARLVRKTLSFSKKLENHIGAIWMFIHEYNRLVRKKMAEREGAIFPLSFTKMHYPMKLMVHPSDAWGGKVLTHSGVEFIALYRYVPSFRSRRRPGR